MSPVEPTGAGPDSDRSGQLNEVVILENELAARVNAHVDATAGLPTLFNEDAYLDAFPDVVSAIRRGDVASATDHFTRFGSTENRLDASRYRKAVETIDTADFPPFGLDALFVTYSGRCLVIGWVDDTQSALRRISLFGGKDHLGETEKFARCRRPDGEAQAQSQPGALLGFWALLQIQHPTHRESGVAVALSVGRFRKICPVRAQTVDERRLRELCLEYLASVSYFGNPQVDGAMQLDSGVGDALIELNARVSSRIMRRGAYCRRFGPQRSRFEASIVVCLYGKPEFLFLQASFFSSKQDWADYEFIYVVNSPEIAEQLIKEATLTSRIYDTTTTLVILSGNAGFGTANNLAIQHARSDRILICNPDVFPYTSGLGRVHRDLVATRPAHETRLFGAPLFYDDGSLMHGGMFFELDEGVSVQKLGMQSRTLARVEHYGKGAPPRTDAFCRARPVPAVTGAFMSVDRRWFEQLGGFSPEYVFGHYEDADLCLKSLMKGQSAWLQPLPLWHLEGKGSSRRAAHEGGALVNRWHFSRTWGELIAFDMRGREPRGLERLTSKGPTALQGARDRPRAVAAKTSADP